MDEISGANEIPVPHNIDWERPAETLEEANLRITALYQAVDALLGDGPFYDVRDMNRRKADIILHPERQAGYHAYDTDWTRAEGG